MNAGFRQCGLPSSYLRNRRVANRGPVNRGPASRGPVNRGMAAHGPAANGPANPGAQKKERAQGPFFMLPMHRASGNRNASVLSL